MNLLDQLLFQTDPELGRLYRVPDSNRLNGMCWSKQKMYHDQFKYDTHAFFSFMRDEDGELVYARVYPRKVDDSIRVRNMPIWIRYTGERRFPKGLLEETPYQFSDPFYLMSRVNAERNLVSLERSIEELLMPDMVWEW